MKNISDIIRSDCTPQWSLVMFAPVKRYHDIIGCRWCRWMFMIPLDFLDTIGYLWYHWIFLIPLHTYDTIAYSWYHWIPTIQMDIYDIIGCKSHLSLSVVWTFFKLYLVNNKSYNNFMHCYLIVKRYPTAGTARRWIST